MKKKGISRRDFLRLSAVGAGTLLVGDTLASTITNAAQQDGGKPKIPTRILGRTGIEVPILSMGVMRADNPNMLRAAYNNGIFHYDTAHGYQKGRNEEMMGKFFEGKPRESFNIGTKVKSRHPWSETMEKELWDRFELSLQRLKTDYTDIFYAHDFRTVEEVKDQRMMAVLTDIKKSGKAKFLGFSTHANDLIPDLLDAAVQTGFYDVVLISYNFRMKNLDRLEPAIERAAKAGIGIVIMKSMAGGTEDAAGKKLVNAQACLKWVWQNPNITTVIPGFSNYDEFDQCLAAVADPQITAGEKEYLAALCDEESLFCQQCGTCASQCPKGMPVPDLMRAYMYTYGYKYPSMSKETIAGLELPSGMCSGCSQCSVTCPSGFDVKGKIAAIAPVVNVPDIFLA